MAAVMPLMKKGAVLCYSHGFNIVEEGMQIRKDLTVIMVAPKCPGTEVREEYKRGFGVPTLIAVHRENDPDGEGWDIAKAFACGTGGDRAGVLESSFVAEVKIRPDGRADHPLRHAPGRLAALLRQDGREGHRRRLTPPSSSSTAGKPSPRRSSTAASPT